MMQNMKWYDQQANRTVLESSDSTDDVEQMGRHLPPPPLSPLNPTSPQHDCNTAVHFGTPPTSSSHKKPHPRRKRRLTGRTSPERELHPITTPSLDTKANPALVPNIMGTQFSPGGQKSSGKVVPTSLNLRGANDTEGNRHLTEGGSKSDDSLEPPITPGGTLSPAVDELLRSLQHKASPSSSAVGRERTHRRTGSGGSGNLPPQLMPGRSSSASAATGSQRQSYLLEMAGVRRSSSPSSLPPSYWTRSSKHHQQQQTIPLLREHREKASIPYSKLDSSDSDSDTETFQEQDNSSYSGTSSALNRGVLKTHQESQLLSSTLAHGGHSSATPTSHHHQPPTIHLLPPSASTTLQPPLSPYSPALSNEGSCDVTGTDGHDADSESDCGEKESTTDDHYPTTTAAETTSQSFSLSLSPTLTFSSATPHPPSTSSDHGNTSPLSSSSLGSPIPPNFPSSSLYFPSSSSPVGTPRQLSPPPPPLPTLSGEGEPEFGDLTTTEGEAEGEVYFLSRRDERASTSEEDACESSITSQGQVAMLISQFEVGLNDTATAMTPSNEREEAPDVPTSPAAIPPESPRLEIPLHIRRKKQHQQLTSGSYSPVKVEQALSLLHDSGLGNSTTIVRHFFENIVSKGPPEEVGMNRTYSTTTELEDSGFQVISYLPLLSQSIVSRVSLQLGYLPYLLQYSF